MRAVVPFLFFFLRSVAKLKPVKGTNGLIYKMHHSIFVTKVVTVNQK